MAEACLHLSSIPLECDMLRLLALIRLYCSLGVSHG